MTRERIAELLEMLVLQLANGTPPPAGVDEAEWAYIKGLASGKVFELKRLVVEAGR